MPVGAKAALVLRPVLTHPSAVPGHFATTRPLPHCHRGAKNAYLNTFSFQAPEFYKTMGYKEFGRLDNFPTGHTPTFLTKAL